MHTHKSDLMIESDIEAQLRRERRKRIAGGNPWETKTTSRVEGTPGQPGKRGDAVYTRFWGRDAWEKAKAFRDATGGEMKEISLEGGYAQKAA